MARLIAWLLVSASLVVHAHAVHASSMVPKTPGELAAESDVVSIGYVEAATTKYATVNGRRGIFTFVRFRVIESLRGRNHGRSVDFVVHGGRVGRDASVVHGQASYAVGETLVVFLFRGGDVLWPTGMAQGKWAIGREDGDELRASSAADPSTFVARPDRFEPPRTMRLADLRAAVLGTVAQ